MFGDGFDFIDVGYVEFDVFGFLNGVSVFLGDDV